MNSGGGDLGRCVEAWDKPPARWRKLGIFISFTRHRETRPDVSVFLRFNGIRGESQV